MGTILLVLKEYHDRDRLASLPKFPGIFSLSLHFKTSFAGWKYIKIILLVVPFSLQTNDRLFAHKMKSSTKLLDHVLFTPTHISF